MVERLYATNLAVESWAAALTGGGQAESQPDLASLSFLPQFAPQR